MGVKVVKRNPGITEIPFGVIAIGEMFSFTGNPDSLYVKTSVGEAIRIENENLRHTSPIVLSGDGVPCFKVDVNIEWCVASSI